MSGSLSSISVCWALKVQKLSHSCSFPTSSQYVCFVRVLQTPWTRGTRQSSALHWKYSSIWLSRPTWSEKRSCRTTDKSFPFSTSSKEETVSNITLQSGVLLVFLSLLSLSRCPILVRQWEWKNRTNTLSEKSCGQRTANLQLHKALLVVLNSFVLPNNPKVTDATATIFSRLQKEKFILSVFSALAPVDVLLVCLQWTRATGSTTASRSARTSGTWSRRLSRRSNATAARTPSSTSSTWSPPTSPACSTKLHFRRHLQLQLAQSTKRFESCRHDCSLPHVLWWPDHLKCQTEHRVRFEMSENSGLLEQCRSQLPPTDGKTNQCFNVCIWSLYLEGPTEFEKVVYTETWLAKILSHDYRLYFLSPEKCEWTLACVFLPRCSNAKVDLLVQHSIAKPTFPSDVTDTSFPSCWKLYISRSKMSHVFWIHDCYQGMFSSHFAKNLKNKAVPFWNLRWVNEDNECPRGTNKTCGTCGYRFRIARITSSESPWHTPTLRPTANLELADLAKFLFPEACLQHTPNHFVRCVK